MQAAVDIRADPMLYEACKEDSESLCKGVKNGGGRIQACLVSSAGTRNLTGLHVIGLYLQPYKLLI
jgi:hypothetical protein